MEMGKKKAPEGFLPEPFLSASPFLKGTYSRTFNFITLVLILPLVLPHGVVLFRLFDYKKCLSFTGG